MYKIVIEYTAKENKKYSRNKEHNLIFEYDSMAELQEGIKYYKSMKLEQILKDWDIKLIASKGQAFIFENENIINRFIIR